MKDCFNTKNDLLQQCIDWEKESPGATKVKLFVKRGMAYKAFLKYCETNDTKNIQRQISKGLIYLYI